MKEMKWRKIKKEEEKNTEVIKNYTFIYRNYRSSSDRFLLLIAYNYNIRVAKKKKWNNSSATYDWNGKPICTMPKTRRFTKLRTIYPKSLQVDGISYGFVREYVLWKIQLLCALAAINALQHPSKCKKVINIFVTLPQPTKKKEQR